MVCGRFRCQPLGWALLCTFLSFSIVLCVYTCVAARLAWPNRSFTAFSSAPLFIKWVAKLCRST